MPVCTLCRDEPGVARHEEWTLASMWQWISKQGSGELPRFSGRCQYCINAWLSNRTRVTASIRDVLEFSEELRYQAAMADLAR